MSALIDSKLVLPDLYFSVFLWICLKHIHEAEYFIHEAEYFIYEAEYFIHEAVYLPFLFLKVLWKVCHRFAKYSI